jgi:hypothetical protein
MARLWLDWTNGGKPEASLAYRRFAKKKSIEKPLGVPGFAGYCIMAG